MAKRRSKGLCPSCPKRAECAKPCGALEAELDRQCGYQRELLVSLETLELLAERAAELGHHWNDVPNEGETERSWDTIQMVSPLSRREAKVLLTRRQAQVLELVIWEGLSVTQTARRLRIHRSAALRRYLNALSRLQKWLDPSYAFSSQRPKHRE